MCLARGLDSKFCQKFLTSLGPSMSIRKVRTRTRIVAATKEEMAETELSKLLPKSSTKDLEKPSMARLICSDRLSMPMRLPMSLRAPRLLVASSIVCGRLLTKRTDSWMTTGVITDMMVMITPTTRI